MLKIIEGRIKSGKTSYILESIKKDIENGKVSYFMVPEQMTLENEKMLLNQLKMPLFLTKVMSFERLSKKVIGKFGGKNKSYIDDVGKVMLLESILDLNKDLFKTYRLNLFKTSFLEEMVKLLKEFRESDISYKVLMNLSKNLEENNEYFSNKIKEIALIYKIFYDQMETKYEDNESRLKFLGENIGEYVKNNRFNVYFDNFTNFTKLEYNVIEELLKNNIDVTVAVNYDKSENKLEELEDVFLLQQEVVEELEKISLRVFGNNKKNISIYKDFFNEKDKFFKEKENEGLNIVKLHKAYINNEEIAHFEKNFGKTYAEAFKNEPKNIQVVKLENTKDEIRYVAETIRGLIKEKDLRYRDILISCTCIKKYEKILRETFEEYEIPYFIDIKKSVLGENIVALIFNFLDFFIKGKNFINVISILKSGFFDEKKDYINLYENFLIKWGCNKNKFINENIFEDEKYFTEEFIKNKDEIININIEINNIIKKYRKIFVKKSMAKVFSDDIVNFLEDLKVKEKIQHNVNNLKKIGELKIAARMSRVYNILLITLDKINEVLEEYEISISTYKKMLYNGLKNTDIAIIPPSVDALNILDISRSKSLGKKVVFLIGVNDTLLPNIKSRNLILGESDRNILIENEINIKNNLENLFYMEKAYMYELMAKADSNLILTYPINDIEKNGAKSAIYINIIKNIFPKLKEREYDEDFFEIGENISKKAFLNYIFKNFEKNKKEEFENEEYLKYFKFLQDEEYFQKEINFLMDYNFKNKEDEKIKEEFVKKIYSLPLKTSISQIETYVKCPFLHFLKYGIKPQKRESEEIDFLKSGLILHKYMEKFSKKIEKETSLKDLEKEEKLNEFIEEIYNEDDFFDDKVKLLVKNSKKNEYFINRLKDISKKVTKFMLSEKKGTSFKTEYVEKELDRIELEINKSEDEDLNKILIGGIVDRVDVYKENNKEYIKIVDYKSSVKKIDLNDIYNGLNMQILFYLYAFTNEENKISYGAFYMPMIDKKVFAKEDMDMELIQSMIKEEMKQKGVILDDINMVKNLENEITEKSEFYDLKIKKDKLSGNSVLTEKEMDLVIKKVIENIKNVANEILKGNIKPYPIKGVCDYCDYKRICKFDERLPNYNYRNLEKLDKEEVILKIEEDLKEK